MKLRAWNSIARIKQALRTNEVHGLEWEIIVCDNASTDDTAEVACRAGEESHELGILERGPPGATGYYLSTQTPIRLLSCWRISAAWSAARASSGVGRR